MDTNQVNQIIEALKPLADKFGQGAQQFYQLAIRQVYIGAAEYVIWLVLLVYGLKKSYEWAKDSEKDEMLRFGAGLLFTLCAVLTAVCVCFAIENLLNPQYKAISQIIGMVIPQPTAAR